MEVVDYMDFIAKNNKNYLSVDELSKHRKRFVQNDRLIKRMENKSFLSGY